jgi:fructan beta-fructosidase
MVGWMNNWQYAACTPSQGWRSAMSLVREVRLETRAGRPVLVQAALDPFSGTELFTAGPEQLADGVRWLPAEASGDVLRIDAEFRPGSAGKVGLVLRAGEADGVQERTVLAYSSLSGELSLDRTGSGNVGFHADFPSVERVPVSLDGGLLRLRIFLDRCSVEVFAQDGLVTLTDQIFPAESSTAVGLLAEGDGATLVSLSVTG